VSLLMAGLTVVFGIAMLVDPRTIEGVPAWLKPAKFAVSTAIYGATLAWMLGALADWPRLRRRAVWTTSVVFVGEVALIAVQAWRGTPSHFNTSTLFDGAVFTAMGLGIFSQDRGGRRGGRGLVAAPVRRSRHGVGDADGDDGCSRRCVDRRTDDPADSGATRCRRGSREKCRGAARTRWARPTADRACRGTRWSLEHGDLRVPHFVGLHAMQALPLFVWALARLRREAVRGAPGARRRNQTTRHSSPSCLRKRCWASPWPRRAPVSWLRSRCVGESPASASSHSPGSNRRAGGRLTSAWSLQ
jgi:hypothetical protein